MRDNVTATNNLCWTDPKRHGFIKHCPRIGVIKTFVAKRKFNNKIIVYPFADDYMSRGIE